MPIDYTSMVEKTEAIWEGSILPSLSEFIEIHALSPGFEPNWAELGELDATIDLFCGWLDTQDIQGLTYETHRIG
ncbi:MAG: peptidase M20, partial [Candidatus Poseidoniia archaeon]